MLVLVYTPLLQSSGSSSLFLLLDVGGSLWASLGNGSAGPHGAAEKYVSFL